MRSHLMNNRGIFRDAQQHLNEKAPDQLTNVVDDNCKLVKKPDVEHGSLVGKIVVPDGVPKKNSIMFFLGRYMVIILLIVQNASSLLVMKWASRIPGPDGKQAMNVSIVAMAEALKVSCCVLEILVRQGARGVLREIWADIFCKWKETFLSMIPSVLYSFQNNLHFAAVAYLDPPLVVVIAQIKILATALFSILILRKVIETRKWLAICLLTCGCVMTKGDHFVAFIASLGDIQPRLHQSIGLMCALSEAFISGLAGVLCELCLKTGSVSISIRNIQLGIPSLLFCLMFLLVHDEGSLSSYGLLQGFTGWTWIAVILHAFGGLVTALVMKHFDNIIRVFAVAGSLVISSLFSVLLYDFVITPCFAAGTSIIVFATYLYTRPTSI